MSGPVALPSRFLRARPAFRAQAHVATGQLGAGVGNLAFALIMARALTPAQFTDFAAFLALYLLVFVPLTSLTAGGALAPGLAARARRRALLLGVAAGGLFAVSAPWAGPILGVEPALLLALAAACPTAGVLELERGRLYGSAGHRSLVASLLAEPATRLVAGIALALFLGPVGAAAGVVLGGWVALAAALSGPRSAATDDAGERSSRATVLAFLLIAALQNGGVLLASAALSAGDAAQFAAVATLGGIAAYATMTLPLVLLGGQGGDGVRGLGAAVGLAVLLGGGAAVVVLAFPRTVTTLVLGERYAPAAPLAGPLTAAMALLGVARVLVADALARGRAAFALAAASAAVLVPVVGLAVGLDDARGLVWATLGATGALTLSVAAPPMARRLRLRRASGGRRARAPRRWTSSLSRPELFGLAALTALALVLRLSFDRGLWLDEATSLYQAQLPFGRMLEVLRTSDVHPPGHHALLWLTVRVIGDSELALRLPSILIGTLLAPLLYAAGRELYDRRAGMAAAALGACAPVAIWYAQEARMYALVMVFAVLALLGQARAMRRGRMRDWALYALGTAAMLYSHYFTVLQVLVQQAAFAAWVWRGHRAGEPLRARLLPWIVAVEAVLVVLLPLVPYAFDQVSANEASGRGFSQEGGGFAAAGEGGLSVYTVLTNLSWALWGYHGEDLMARVGSLWPVGLLFGLALLGRGRSRTSVLLAAIVLVPGAVLFVVGLEKRDLFELRYFLFAIPMLLLLLARALTDWGERPRGRVLAIAGVAAVMLVGVADQELNGANPRVYGFEYALDRIERQIEPGDRVVYAPPYLNNLVNYYAPEIDADPLGDRDPIVPPNGRLFLLASFLDNPRTARRVGGTVARLRREERLVEVTSRNQVRVWEFR